MKVPKIEWLAEFMLGLAERDKEAHRTVSDSIIFNWAKNGNYADTLSEIALVMDEVLIDDDIESFYKNPPFNIEAMLTEWAIDMWKYGSGKEPYDPDK